MGPSTPGSWQESDPSVFPSYILSAWGCRGGLAAVTRALCPLFHAPTVGFQGELFLENWETASTAPVSDPPCSPPAFWMKVGGEKGVAGDWSCCRVGPWGEVGYVPMVCGVGTREGSEALLLLWLWHLWEWHALLEPLTCAQPSSLS